MRKKIFRTKLLALAFLVAMLGSYAPAVADVTKDDSPLSVQSAIWDSEVVDDRGGSSASMALDANGRPHISYVIALDEFGTRGLMYAKYTGSTWVKETVDKDSRPNTTDIAVESPDEIHISFLDRRSANLKYAHKVNSKWVIQTVDKDPDAGWSSSIALHSNGYPRIAYWDDTPGDQAVKYARWNGEKWVLETIADVTCDPGYLIPLISLAIDSSNLPHITYSDCEQNALMYAHNDGSGWKKSKVAGGTLSGVDNSLAIDSKQKPVIAYHTRGVSYAVSQGSGWNIQAVDLETIAGLSTSLALDEDDRPYISYLNRNADEKSEVVLAYRIDATWRFEKLATSAKSKNFMFGFVNVAVDKSGYPHLVYNDFTNDDLIYVTGDLRIGSGPVYLPAIYKNH
jgi:hypothetical protein